MPNPAPRTRYRAGLLLLAALLLALPHAVGAAPQADGELQTRYFTIRYPAGEEQAAAWYGEFVDQVDTAVSELLGAAPVPALTLRLYATEAEYQAANPLAGLHPGIMAHAIPEEKLIGVAVERLRQTDPALARESFRHEMTHVVAGALAGQNLPIGFQEGLAQYNELSAERGKSVVAALAAAESAGSELLTWAQLNNRRLFQRQIYLAYPTSYTVMAYLAEEYGMGAYGRFLGRLAADPDYEAALAAAYGKSAAVLEAGWRAWLPGFRQGDGGRNVLADYDLAPARALYQAGQYAAAVEGFTRAAALYSDLGRPERAAEAAAYRDKATQAAAAAAEVDKAQTALAAHDYPVAQTAASGAAATFALLGLADEQARAKDVARRAGDGVAAGAALARAAAAWRGLDWMGAAGAASAAAATFAALDDAPRLAQANAILDELWLAQRVAGGGVGLAGMLLLLGGGLWALRARRRARVPQLPTQETPAWL